VHEGKHFNGSPELLWLCQQPGQKVKNLTNMKKHTLVFYYEDHGIPIDKKKVSEYTMIYHGIS
jgi:hypothetical protein